jgi:hypothetical protein
VPIHEWTRVDASIFHHFHHDWITEMARALNRGLLPADFYALAEQHAAGFGPDVLTLQGEGNGGADDSRDPMPAGGGGGVLMAAPALQPTAETDMAFYRRKQKTVTVRHVSGDRIIAMIEVVSPGNQAARNPLRAFVAKAAELLEHGVHLLILDLFPPGRRDPHGIHAEIWEEIAGEECTPLPSTDKAMTFAAYESGLSIRAYVKHAGVGDSLPDMPLFLESGKAVAVPLEATYSAAFAEVPRRWRRVLEAPAE